MRPTIFTLRVLNYVHTNGLVGQHVRDIPADVCPPHRVQVVARELMQLEMIPKNVPRQVVGRISLVLNVGVVGSARPRCTSLGRFHETASWGRSSLYSIR